YANPITWMYSAARYSVLPLKSKAIAVRPIGTDAAIPASDTDRELIILVVGEAVRADRLSLNGYGKETNPYTAKEDVISFSRFYSSGTSTAVSVPCMFSVFGRSGYSDKRAHDTENLLDVLSHAGVHVLWRENNSSSKGVADRVAYEDYQNPKVNPVHDVECRDEGMLEGLQDYVDRIERGDILIVLHQMGNHGPAYYKRYPREFEKFTPVCGTNQMEECTREEIENAYANAVLYTDYFLSRVIDLLKKNTERFETAMVYVSDHGESLGENHIYLHGLPYFMAPDSQKHVAALMWFGKSFDIDKEALRAKAHLPFSHDHLFHTILGLMEVRTSVYNRKLDILNYDR
ncbi:MAG: phosphoethanolamine transferase, partial [Deltaproteobacteria bacterium]